MCDLNCSALRQLNGSTIAIANPRTSQHGEASTSPKRTIIKPVALYGCGGYKTSFEACLVDLGGHEKHNFQQRCWKTAESVMAWRGSPSILISLLHSGPFSDWLLLLQVTEWKAANRWHSNTLKRMRKQARSQLLTTHSGFSWYISNTALGLHPQMVCLYIE